MNNENTTNETNYKPSPKKKSFVAVWVPESKCMYHDKEYIINSRGLKAREKAISLNKTYTMNERKHLRKIKTGEYTGGHWEFKN